MALAKNACGALPTLASRQPPLPASVRHAPHHDADDQHDHGLARLALMYSRMYSRRLSLSACLSALRLLLTTVLATTSGLLATIGSVLTTVLATTSGALVVNDCRSSVTSSALLNRIAIAFPLIRRHHRLCQGRTPCKQDVQQLGLRGNQRVKLRDDLAFG